MAYVGEWGTFIHIPKTGGMAMRKALERAYGPGEEVGYGHGIPTSRPNAWALVRKPAPYLRSLWAWGLRYKWQPYGREIWREVLDNELAWASWLTWEVFVETVCTRRPGLVGRVFEYYYRPDIRYFQLENLGELYDYLGRELVMTYENVNSLTDKARMTPAQAALIEKTEGAYLEKYYK